MCGIAGAFFVRDRALIDRFARQATLSLAHRGPDDADRLDLPEGTLVHRRLSILDPSPAGRQPFASSDGRRWVIHNGEIYNYLELRDQLRGLGHVFTTNTDTEVILAAHRQWGVEAVEHFNGIWAFAIWDETSRTLLLSRDRLGVKPLYVTEQSGGTFFASEIKALLPIIATRSPNIGALRDYAWHGLVDHADDTFFAEVRPVPPATCLVVREAATTAWRYWSLEKLASDARPEAQAQDDETVATFGSLLRSAIGLQLRSDVPLGTCLSGGIDSSTIVALSAEHIKRYPAGPHQAAPRVAITASFPGFVDDESARASLMARAAAIDHVVVPLETGDLLETLACLLEEQDEPFISSSVLAQRSVMRAAAAAGVKVMLDGQGADELLGGYPHYRYPWLLGIALTSPGALPRAVRALYRLGISPSVAVRQALLAALQLGPTGVAPIGRASRPPSWIGPVLRRANPLPLRPHGLEARGATPLARHLVRAVLSTSLPALLRYEDRNSMRFAIEARVPYLDHRLVEAAMLLPDRLKIDRGITKAVLRRAARGAVPDVILNENRKIGFAAPQRSWLDSARPAISALFADSVAVRSGLADPDQLARLAKLRTSPHDDVSLWRAVSLELWLRGSAAIA